MNNVFMKPKELKIHRYPMLAIESNMYFLICEDSALVIDPNVNSDAIIFLKNAGVTNCVVFLTHEHFDHVSGVNAFRKSFDCHVICSPYTAKSLPDPSRNMAKYWDVLMMDKPPAIQKLGLKVKNEDYSCFADEIIEKEEDIVEWKNYKIRTVFAPGHSKGGMLFFLEDYGILFSGDNLVNGTGVMYRFPGGSWKNYYEKTLPIIQNLPDDTVIYPGHGLPDKLKALRKYLVKFENK